MPEDVRKEAKTVADYDTLLVADKFIILEKVLKCTIFVHSSEGKGGFHVVYTPRDHNRDKGLKIIGYDRETTHF